MKYEADVMYKNEVVLRMKGMEFPEDWLKHPDYVSFLAKFKAEGKNEDELLVTSYDENNEQV